MFSIIDWFKALTSDKAPTTHRTVLKTPLSTMCKANPIVEAIVTQTIAPGTRGQVKFQGSWWTARSVQGLTLIPGKVVHVIGRQDITLYVEPAFLTSAQGH